MRSVLSRPGANLSLCPRSYANTDRSGNANPDTNLQNGVNAIGNPKPGSKTIAVANNTSIPGFLRG